VSNLLEDLLNASATSRRMRQELAVPELIAALERCAVMLERVVKRGGFVVGCDAAAKEARKALTKAGEA
jgi:hypothetical protein